MKCDEALAHMLEADVAHERVRRAQVHVANCSDCRAAMLARDVLAHERAAAAPEPAPGAAARAIRAAVRANAKPSDTGRTFVRGMLAGAGIAAAIALAVIVTWPAARAPGPVASPRIAMALNESKAVNISLDTLQAMRGAEIHVLVTGDVGLDGYAGQRELRWTTDLATGSNQLTIPVVAIGASGGQLVVEVEHEMKRRTFLVDIEGAG